MITRRTCIMAALLAFCLGHDMVRAGQTCTWTADTDGNWSDGANWDLGVPGPNDDALFNGSGVGAATIDAGFAGAVSNVIIASGYSGTLTQRRDLSVGGNFEMHGGIWQFAAGTAAALTVTNNMLLTNCTVRCQYTSVSGSGLGRTFTVGGNLTVATNSLIDADGMGFAAKQGPGAATANQGGGGYGGEGGDWGGRTEYVGTCYGSIKQPDALGSGGYSGAAGGAIRLIVSGHTQVDGVITANGPDMGSTGAGSGGSVWLTSGTLSGTGLVCADGGKGGSYNTYGYGHGGGGRIAVYLLASDDFGQIDIRAISKRGAYANHRGGGAGSVYFHGVSATHGTCVYDSRGVLNVWRSVINDQVADRGFDDFVIDGTTEILVLEADETLHIYGSWSNAATFSPASSGVVSLEGTGTATLYGNSTFGRLSCTNAGKTIRFEAGKTFTLTDALTLQGAVGNLVTLRSTDTNAWNLTVPLLSHVVDYVDAEYSNAGGGSSVEALHSTDSGNNNNWIFAQLDQTNTWIGTTSTAWSTVGNWSLGRPPSSFDYIVISNPCSFYPSLDDNKVLLGLTVENGASLNLAGYNATFESNVVVAGTLTATASEVVALRGDADFSGGTFNRATSTVRLEGTSAQSMTFGGNTFYQLTLDNDAAQVTFADAAAAANLTDQGAGLVASGTVTVSGTLTTDGDATFLDAVSAQDLVHSTGSLAFAGAVTAGGSIVSDAGDVVFGGPVVSPVFTKDAGDLTFSNSLTATDFANTAAGDAITFAAGAEYNITNLTLFGGGGSRITLRSGTPASYWALNVLGWHAVGHVDVQDSDASGGMTIVPILSTNSGHNLNWDFTTTDNWQSWDGSAGDNFSTADNWTPAGTPDATSWLLIDGNHSAAPVVSAVSTAGVLVVGGNADATLTLNKALTVTGGVSVLAGGTLTHGQNTTTHLYSLDLTVGGDLSVRGSIDVSGKGFRSDYGPGTKTGTQGGGGHGGMGGYWGNVGYGGGTCYGSIPEPTTLGSGGDNGYGGGCIRLAVTGATALAGTISADGANHTSSGAGAGGSIWLTTGTLSGPGRLSAEGGRGGAYGGTGYAHGGGGRIALYLASDSDVGDVAVSAASKVGAVAGTPGGAGTIYLKTAGDSYGSLIVDNNSAVTPASVSTLFSTNVAGRDMGDVVLRGLARLQLDDNETLAVYGSWSNGAVFAADAGTTVWLAGTNAATLAGDTTFVNLTCTNGGKQVNFTAGDTFSVTGILTLTGVENNLLNLDSSGAGQWNLVVPVAPHNVRHVDVQDSDASGGATVEAFDSFDGGNNVGWIFASSGAEVNTWIGVTSTDWSTNSNWALGRQPIASDWVVVSNPCSFYPVLDNDKIIGGLTISAGASLNLSGYNLGVTNHTIVAGTLTATGSETITLEMDVDFSGGTFVEGSSTVRIEGSGPQAITCDGNPFHDVVVANAGATVTFTDSVVASNLTNQGTDLVVTGDVAVAEALTTTSGDVTILGTCSAGTLTHDGGSLVFGDGVTVASTLDNNAGDMQFRGTLTVPTFTIDVGSLSFSNTVTVTDFTSTAAGSTMTVAPSANCNITNLSLFGTAGSAITLRSALGGSYWGLRVGSWNVVGHVDVSDSDASGGMTIAPVASTDSGHNLNWDFSRSTDWQIWDGSAGSSFVNADNWTPAGAPDADSWVLIDGNHGAAPTFSGTATVGQIIVGGYDTATLTINGHLTVTGDVSVLASGTLTHSANSTVPTYKLAVTAGGGLFVGGAIDVTGKGYAAKNGPGKATLNQGGGGYGGEGGDWGGRTAYVGRCYGSIPTPTQLGSGGVGGAGGGAIRLLVTGNTHVSGQISANSPPSGSTGTGSGGSIWLTSGTLTGMGVISADGGKGGTYLGYGYGHGGGGRIAVHLTGGDDFGSVEFRATSARGADSVHRGGGAGSVYLRGASDTHGVCIYDSLDVLNVWRSTINAAVTNATVGDFVLRGNTTSFRIEDGGTLAVNGSWSNAAPFVSTTGGVVRLEGTGEATVFDSNTFGGLSCIGPDKTVRFEAGTTTTVNGRLETLRAKLRSTENGSWWYLDLAAGASQSVLKTDAKDSHAGAGQTIQAGKGSHDLGNNVNWTWPPGAFLILFR